MSDSTNRAGPSDLAAGLATLARECRDMSDDQRARAMDHYLKDFLSEQLREIHDNLARLSDAVQGLREDQVRINREVDRVTSDPAIKAVLAANGDLIAMVEAFKAATGFFRVVGWIFGTAGGVATLIATILGTLIAWREWGGG